MWNYIRYLIYQISYSGNKKSYIGYIINDLDILYSKLDIVYGI